MKMQNVGRTAVRHARHSCDEAPILPLCAVPIHDVQFMCPYTQRSDRSQYPTNSYQQPPTTVATPIRLRKVVSTRDVADVVRHHKHAECE